MFVTLLLAARELALAPAPADELAEDESLSPPEAPPMRSDADPELGHLTCLVDSNGACDLRVWDDLAPVFDGAMIDLKCLDPEIRSGGGVTFDAAGAVRRD